MSGYQSIEAQRKRTADSRSQLTLNCVSTIVATNGVEDPSTSEVACRLNVDGNVSLPVVQTAAANGRESAR